jgi:hypothetical protein
MRRSTRRAGEVDLNHPREEITMAIKHAIIPHPWFDANAELNGQEFAAINGGPVFQFNEAVSLLIWCDTQPEIDALWNKPADGGSPNRCGWLKDRAFAGK